MELRYQYSLPDYRALTHAMMDQGRFSRWWRRWALYLAIVLMVAGVPLVAVSNIRGWHIQFIAIVLAGVGFAIIAIQYVVVLLQIRHYYRKQSLAGALVEIDATEADVRTNDRGVESRIDWSAFVRADDAPGYHFLWLNRMQGIVVPDRVFASQAQRQEFRELVERQMPDRVKWQRRSTSRSIADRVPE